MNLSPLPVQRFYSNIGLPLVGGKLFTYAAGANTKIATFKDSSGTLNTNPIILNFRGEADVWLDPELTYKFVLAGPFDTDPPTNPIWTVDNIAGSITISDLTQQFLGRILFPRTQAEISANVTPTNFAVPSHDAVGYVIPSRYGADKTGSTPSDVAFNRAIAVSAQAAQATILFENGVYLFQTEIVIGYGIMVMGTGSQGTTEPYGTVFMHDSNGNFLKWDGSGGAGFRGTGGGLKNVTILKSTGRTGGIAIYLFAIDDDRRPGEMMLENVLVFGDGTGLWTKAIEVDGRNANTAGGRGVRTIHFNKVRVAECTANNQYIHLRQATHVCGNVQIDTGDGTGTNGMTLDDVWDNIYLLVRVGNVVVNYSGVDVPTLQLSGSCENLDVNYASVVGNADITVGSSITNASHLFVVSSFKGDAFFAYRTSTAANVTGAGTQYTVVYEAEAFDRNGSMDIATGIFTVKAAGLYQFNYAVTLDDVAAGMNSAVLNLLHQNASSSTVDSVDTHGGNIGAIPDAGGGISLNNSIMLECLEGDTIRVRITVSGGAGNTVDVIGSAGTRYTYFTGKVLA